MPQLAQTTQQQWNPVWADDQGPTDEEINAMAAWYAELGAGGDSVEFRRVSDFFSVATLARFRPGLFLRARLWRIFLFAIIAAGKRI